MSLQLVRAAKFEALLHYSYSGTLALGWGCVFDLTCTSLQLQFQTAYSLCLNFLEKEIDAYNCLDVVSFAEAYGMSDLLALANNFVLRHFQDVSITPKFHDLPVEKFKKYLQSDSLYVPSELPVFKAVMSWIEAYPKQRVKLARELMGSIRFPLLTFNEFNEVMSVTSWPKIGGKNVYKSLFKEFFSGSSDVQSNIRVYMPKDTLVLVGGEKITDNCDKHRPCREMWFSNSLQNHVGLVKKVEWKMLGTLPETPRFSHGVGAIRGKLIKQLLDSKVIRESSSPYASPIVLVQKKSGELRMCVDYRQLNAKTRKDAYPLPRIEESLDALAGAQWFSTLDLASGYNQVPVAERDKAKTAFCTPFGLFEFERMPFGLCNAPGTFQRLMERIFGDQS